MNAKTNIWRCSYTALLIGLVPTSHSELQAHCDTMDGPVIRDARVALATGDVTPVLKWARPEDEQEIRQAFEKALAVRGLNDAARELADRFFFETVVRVHRAGEGAPYTGLKPAGAVGFAVALADEALTTGSADKLVEVLAKAVAQGIRTRYLEAAAMKKHNADSVEAGREFVKAYVEYAHFVEGLHRQLDQARQRHVEAGHELQENRH